MSRSPGEAAEAEYLRADLAGPVLDGLRWAYPYRLAQAPARPGVPRAGAYG